MTSLPELLQQGTAHAWLFVPSAILLGALHGLEPGHSKTVMAAFIIAIRGTVKQAVLLGLAATLSHTAVVWLVGLGGQYIGREWGTEATEPYFQIASAVLIIGVALWMLWRTWQDQHPKVDGHHQHDDSTRRIDTGHGTLTLEVFENGVPPCWRVRFASGPAFAANDVSVVTRRPDGTLQQFKFTDRGRYLESTETIPEPHRFCATLSLTHGTHAHEYAVEFHDHAHAHSAEDADTTDAHARAHARDIERRFAGQKNVTTGQIVMFGLTGGLIPCPAAITVLLLCLQLKQFSLGVVLVLCFSIGLALTMVTAGVVAALSVRHISTRWSGFDAFARRAPYASSALIILVGLYMGAQGFMALSKPHVTQGKLTVPLQFPRNLPS